MQKVPASEIANRIVALQALLKKNRVDVAVLRQNADFVSILLARFRILTSLCPPRQPGFPCAVKPRRGLEAEQSPRVP